MRVPLVSVIIGVHNGQRFLHRAVRSILGQTLTDLELIVVDDGSTDGTGRILSSIRDSRLTVLKNDKNRGLTVSLVRALEVARAPYVARMDADDVSEPCRLERQVSYLETRPEVGLLGAAASRLDLRGRPLGGCPVYTRAKGLQRRLLKHNCFVHGSVVMRRELLEQVGGYRIPFRYAQDYDLWLRLAEYCEVENLEETLYWRRLSPRGISVVRAEQQAAFVALAQQLARERRTHGKELTSAEKASREILAAQAVGSSDLSAGFLAYAQAMLASRYYGACFYYLARSVLARPSNPGPWRWVGQIVAEKSKAILLWGQETTDG